jgi:hypothetical protein
VKNGLVVDRNGDTLRFSSADIAVDRGVLTAATSADGSAPQHIKVESYKEAATLRSSLPMSAFEDMKTIKFEYDGLPVTADVQGAAKTAGGSVTVFTNLGDITLDGTVLTLDAKFLASLGVDASALDDNGRRLLSHTVTVGTVMCGSGACAGEAAPAALVASPSQRTLPCSSSVRTPSVSRRACTLAFPVPAAPLPSQPLPSPTAAC